MKRVLRLGTFLLALCLTVSCAAGCAGAATTSPEPAPTPTASAAQPPTSASAPPPDASGELPTIYPMDTDVILTYWISMNPMTSANYANFGDTPFAKAWMEATGIEIEFECGTGDQFALLMTANLLPDLIHFWWDAYPGGPQKAVSDGKIIPLNQVWDDMPFFSQWMAEHPDIDRMVRYDNGDYIGFPSINGDGSVLPVSCGPAIRKDLLDKVGKAVPETMDEWHDVLTAFKNDLGLEAPLTGASLDLFSRAFGMKFEWYVDDGVVKYGEFESVYKDALATWKQWYDEGLLDRDILNIDSNTARAKVLDGTSGAIFSYWSTLAMFNSTGPETNPEFNVVPAPLPVLQKGAINNAYGYVENPYEPAGPRVQISGSCKNPEIAARAMDYLWGQEGHDLAMWGTEGVTYTVDADGNKSFTDFVKHNPDGWTDMNVRAAYMFCPPGPFYQEFINPQTFVFQQQFDSLEVWGNNATLEHHMPPIMRTAEEDDEFSKIMTDIKTFVEESRAQIILGMMSLNDFEAYLEQMKGMGMERAIAIQQAAYDRFLTK